MNRLLGLSLGLLLAGAACTVDDDIEGLPCDLDKPLNQQCVSGYVCKCESASRDSCFCVAEGRQSGLTAAPAVSAPALPVVPATTAVDPSARFLQRTLRVELLR